MTSSGIRYSNSVALHESRTGGAAHARDRASEMEPVHLRHVALGDRDEAGQARFRREQIVVRRIEPAGAVGIGEAVADREQLALRIEQKPEVHRVEERRRRAPQAAARVSRSPTDSVRSAPARLPLSTVET